MNMKFVRSAASEKSVSLSAMRKKLYSAVAMLLVSAILMASSSYAWFVLSTAPEATGIETQVGANGSLEIALLNTESYNDLLLVTDADIDEGAAPGERNVLASNLNWGNLVNLSNDSYGLSKIVLMPSRLNISQTGEADFTINTNTLLKTPKYGEDGRILALEQTAVSATYDKAKAQFSNTDGYGVRAVGTAASMSVFQRELNSARSVIINNMNAAKTAASQALNSTGSALADIAVQHALIDMSGGTESYTKADVQAMLDLANGMKTALDHIDAAMRQVYVGYICSDGSAVTDDELQSTKETILNPETTLSALQATYPDASARMSTLIAGLNDDQTKVESAIAGCQSAIDQNKESYTWNEISAIMSPLVNYEGMQLNGHGIQELQAVATDMTAAFNIITAGDGLNVTVPTGSGLVSDVADFAGDYQASVTLNTELTVSGLPLQGMTAKMATTTSITPLYLTQCANIIRSYTAKEGGGSSAITDFYGYALDFAVRTNAAGKSHLLLQTESTNRIYDGDTQNANLQGGGSYMQFGTQAGISATKMVKLMRAIRVMFIAKEGKTYGIGALDCTLGKDVYRETAAEEKAANQNLPYVLDNAKTGLDIQYSDCISAEAYAALPETSNVEFDGNGSVKAKLYLYDFSMTMAPDAVEAGLEPTYHKTGGLTLGAQKAKAEIMELHENEAVALTALVYLDGSYVHNSEVASTNTESMRGVLNLQFASDAELIPAENTALRMGPQD